MAIAVADNDDEGNHCNEPPTKRPGARIVSRDEESESGDCEENGGERARDCLKDNMAVPAQAHDANATGAKKVIRIKILGDPVGMPVPKNGGKQRDHGKEP